MWKLAGDVTILSIDWFGGWFVGGDILLYYGMYLFTSSFWFFCTSYYFPNACMEMFENPI